MHRFFYIIGSLFAAMAVAMGAAGGHGETSTLSSEALVWLAKACRYQMYHGLALILCGLSLCWQPQQKKLFTFAGGAFLIGTICFSGSLYLMAFTGFQAGYITPLGGICFLVGWLILAVTGFRLDTSQR